MSAAANQNSMKLILFDKKQKIRFFGNCRLKDDVLEEEEMITLIIDDNEEMFITFDCKIIKRMNLLGIIDDRSKKHMIISFPTRESCSKITNFILRSEPEVRIRDSKKEESEFTEKLFCPLLKGTKIPEYSKLKALIRKFLKFYDTVPDQKQNYLTLIKDLSIPIYPPSNPSSNLIPKREPPDVAPTTGTSNFIELTHADFLKEEKLFMEESMEIEFASSSIVGDDDDSDDEPIGDIIDSSMSDADWEEPKNVISEKKPKIQNLNTVANNANVDDENWIPIEESIVRSPNYKLIDKICGTKIVKKLIVFHPADKNLYYEYNWSKQAGAFKCPSCMNLLKLHISAKLLTDKEGEYVKLCYREHVCEPKSNFEKLSKISAASSKASYEGFKTVQKPYFQIKTMETWKGTQQKYLFLYDEVTKKQISKYTFQPGQNKFLCYGCKFRKTPVTASLRKNAEGEEYIQLSKNEHVCNRGIEKKSVKIVEKPFFQIINLKENNSKTERKNAIIFDEVTKKPLWRYVYYETFKKFVCPACKLKKQKHVWARLLKDDDGNEYMELPNMEHVCKTKSNDLKRFFVKHL